MKLFVTNVPGFFIKSIFITPYSRMRKYISELNFEEIEQKQVNCYFS